MKKRYLIVVLVLIAVTCLLTVALQRPNKEEEGETKSSVHTAISPEQASGEGTTQPGTNTEATTEPAANKGETAAETTQSTQDTLPQGSMGVDENWDEETDGPAATVETTEPVVTEEETVPQTTENEQTAAPSQPDKELTDLTYSQYISLSAQEQEAYYKAFEGDDAFLAWYKEAYAAYLENRETVTGDGKIDINDYIGQ